MRVFEPKFDPFHKPTLERLQELIAAIEGGQVLAREMRAEIADALDFLFTVLLGDEVEQDLSRGGAPVSYQTILDASLVVELKDKHGILIKTGLLTVEPASSKAGERRRAVIAKKVSDIRNGKVQGYGVPVKKIEAALNKIEKKKKP